MRTLRISKDGLNFNEGGYLLTLYWSRRHRFARIWFKPNFWKIGPGLCRSWRW